MTPDPPVLILAYNNANVLPDCLASVKEAGGQPFVWDNGSIDGTHDLLVSLICEEEGPDWGLRFHRNDGNLGFTAGVNWGVEWLLRERPETDWFVLLNSDTLLDEDCLWALARCMEENPSAGIVGCRIRDLHYPEEIVHAGMALSPTGLPIYRRSWLEVERNVWAGENVQAALCWDLHRIGAGNDFSHRETVPGVTFCCVAIRRAAWEEVGPLNEEYWLNCSDTDWCERCWLTGWEVWYEPTAELLHYGSLSIKQAGPTINQIAIADHRLRAERLLEEGRVRI